MCVIIVKPKGAEIPSEEIIEKNYKKNSDGAGIGFTDSNNEILIKKDFGDFDEYYSFIKDNITIDMSALLHMRIRTSGKNDEGGRHPFPITKNEESLRNTELVTDSCVAHNGIFNDFSYKGTDLNDSQLMVSSLVFPNRESLVKDAFRFLLNKYVAKENSKLSILDKNGMYLFGDWKMKNGILYSNSYSVPFDSIYKMKNIGGNCVQSVDDLEEFDKEESTLYYNKDYSKGRRYNSVYGRGRYNRSKNKIKKKFKKKSTNTNSDKYKTDGINVDSYKEYDGKEDSESECEFCHQIMDIKAMKIAKFYTEPDMEFLLCDQCVGLS